MIIISKRKIKAELNAPKEISWDEALSNAKEVDCVEMNSNDYAYIFILQELQVYLKELLEILVVI